MFSKLTMQVTKYYCKHIIRGYRFLQHIYNFSPIHYHSVKNKTERESAVGFWLCSNVIYLFIYSSELSLVYIHGVLYWSIVRSRLFLSSVFMYKLSYLLTGSQQDRYIHSIYAGTQWMTFSRILVQWRNIVHFNILIFLVM